MESGSVNSKSEGLLSRMALNDNKAGMEGLDRDKINKIIMESSKVITNLYMEPRMRIDPVFITLSYSLPVWATFFFFFVFLLFVFCAGI